MNSEFPSRLRYGKLFSRIPVLKTASLNTINTTEMETPSNSQSSSQTELVEAQRNLESRFDSLNSEITELKSLVSTLVQQNSANRANTSDEPQPREYYNPSSDRHRFGKCVYASWASIPRN